MRALLALALLGLAACEPLFTGPTCSQSWVADTATSQGDTTIVAHTQPCLGNFR